MLQVFYLDLVYVLHGFQVFSGVFASVLDACFEVFHLIFRRMLQVLHLDVQK
jgi:hypothetical protein